MESTAPSVARPEPGANDKAISAAALATATGAVLACSACCILPLAIPALALALGVTVLAWMNASHFALTLLSLAMLGGAWFVVWRQSSRGGKRTAGATRIMLAGATLLTVIALCWRWIEPTLVALLRG